MVDGKKREWLRDVRRDNGNAITSLAVPSLAEFNNRTENIGRYVMDFLEVRGEMFSSDTGMAEKTDN